MDCRTDVIDNTRRGSLLLLIKNYPERCSIERYFIHIFYIDGSGYRTERRHTGRRCGRASRFLGGSGGPGGQYASGAFCTAVFQKGDLLDGKEKCFSQ